MITWVVMAVVVSSPRGQPRPRVDVAAMREAMGSREPIPYPSASSYAHFLASRLALTEGDRSRAADELVLALATDPKSPYLRTELARHHARAEELVRAEEELVEVLATTPDYAPAQLLLGRVLLEQKKLARAAVHLKKAIALAPGHPEGYLLYAQGLVSRGRIDEAIAVVNRMGAAIPQDGVGYHRLGLILAHRRDERAGPLLRKAVERDPSDVEAWVALAGHHAARDEGDLALAAYERAVEHEPENRELLLSAGRQALAVRRAADARAFFAQALAVGRDAETAARVAFSYIAEGSLEPAAEVLDQARVTHDEPRLHYYAGLVLQRLHREREAELAFARVGKGLKDVSEDAQVRRAACLSVLGAHAEALAILDEVEQARQSPRGLEGARARVLERAGRVEEAEALLAAAYRARPSVALGDTAMWFFHRQGRPHDAIALFQHTLDGAPGDGALALTLAIALERSGQWERAVALMRTVLVREPRNAAAANFVGYTLASRGKALAEAQRLVEKAVAVDPTSAAFLDSLGWVLHRRGDHRRALVHLRAAVARSSDDPTLHEHLGVVYQALGEPQRARLALEQAAALLEAFPESAERSGQREAIAAKLKLLSARPGTR